MKDLICMNCNEYVEVYENAMGDLVCSCCKETDCFLESEDDIFNSSCRACGGFFLHRKNCSHLSTTSGIAQKILIKQFGEDYIGEIHRLENRINELEMYLGVIKDVNRYDNTAPISRIEDLINEALKELHE